MKTTIIILLLFVCQALATDEAKQAAFFDSVEVRYRQEYKACTGDMKFIDRRELLAWKNTMNTLAVSKDFQALLKEYRKVNSSENFLPCKVLAWNEARRKMQAAHEDTLARELLVREEYENAEKEAKILPQSKYSTFGLPFGLSKKSFLLIFKNTFQYTINDMGNYLYVSDMKWGDRTFLTAFYFDKKTDKFYKYEIEGPSVPADGLNRVVRTDAEFIAHDLTRRFGEPARRYSIGFFDIKSGVLSPFQTWDAPGFNVYVGLSMSKYRYYAKAVVMAREITRPAPSAADSIAAKPD
jgi:hypothetical protein